MPPAALEHPWICSSPGGETLISQQSLQCLCAASRELGPAARPRLFLNSPATVLGRQRHVSAARQGRLFQRESVALHEIRSLCDPSSSPLSFPHLPVRPWNERLKEDGLRLPPAHLGMRPASADRLPPLLPPSFPPFFPNFSSSCSSFPFCLFIWALLSSFLSIF